MSSCSVDNSRVFKKIDGTYKDDDGAYEYAMKCQNSHLRRLAFGIQVPYVFHRYQMQCFDLLVQHYWFREIREIPVSDRKPVPLLVKIALSWMAGEDQTFTTDSDFQALVIKLMQKRVASWKSLRINRRTVPTKAIFSEIKAIFVPQKRFFQEFDDTDRIRVVESVKSHTNGLFTQNKSP